MEFYLKANNITLRLPVNPESFERNIGANYDTETVTGLGDVAVYVSNGLSELTLEGMFPMQDYSFAEYKNIPNPYDYFVKNIKDWKNKGIPARLIITGTDINQEMYITNFKYGERYGPRDVYYSIDLIEYRSIEVPRLNNNVNNNANNNADNSSRPTTNNATTTQRTHTVVRGDTLSGLSKKYYGKSNLYSKIQNANKSKYPSLANNPHYIRDGWVLVIPNA